VQVELISTEAERRRAWELLNGCLAYDHFTWTEFQRKTVGDPGYRPDMFLGAYEGAALIGAMVGVFRGGPGNARCNLKIYGVLAQHRLQGIGSALLARLQETARQAGASSMEVPGGFLYFFPGLDPRYTPAVAFLLRRGFERTGETFNMWADLTAHSWDTAAEEERLKAEGIAVRRVREEDREALGQFMLREFSQVWLMETSLAYANEPATCHVALVHDRIEAFAASQVCGEGWFGPMGTSSALRGKGIGRVLMYRCFRDLRDLGYGGAVIPWVGPPDFYAKFALAHIDRVFWQFRRALAEA